MRTRARNRKDPANALHRLRRESEKAFPLAPLRLRPIFPETLSDNGARFRRGERCAGRGRDSIQSRWSSRQTHSSVEDSFLRKADWRDARESRRPDERARRGPLRRAEWSRFPDSQALSTVPASEIPLRNAGGARLLGAPRGGAAEIYQDHKRGQLLRSNRFRVQHRPATTAACIPMPRELSRLARDSDPHERERNRARQERTRFPCREHRHPSRAEFPRG